ncbi:MFS transporter [Streptosporangium sp. NPDC049644]|uniref:MFS transporter n=1 Tax=Streptosporangium sp. NPDC049644 TaxID=3155507 RepID=UPI003414E506
MDTQRTEVRAPTEKPPSLWRNPDFNRLWAGQSISVLGSELTTLALPLTAILMLQASSLEVGLLNTMRTIAALLLTLIAGVLIDRYRRRPLMVGADIGRAAVVALIPITAFAGFMDMWVLYVVAVVVGGLSVVFEIAYAAYMPTLLSEEQLVAGNSRMAATESVGAIAGSSAGGVLIDLFRPAYVMLGDAISFLVSAFALSRIRHVEPPVERQDSGGRGAVAAMLHDIKHGLRVTYRNAYARPLILNSAGANFGSMMILTLFILYAARELQLSGTWIGFIYAVGSIGGVIGAVFASKLFEKLGYGRGIMTALIAFRVLCFTPFVAGPQWLQITLFSVIWFVTVFGVVAGNIGQLTLFQYVIPNHLRGRVIGASRAVYLGILPLAAMLAGVLGELIGVKPAIYAGAAFLLPWIILLFLSPVPNLRRLEDAEILQDIEEPAAEPAGEPAGRPGGREGGEDS